MKTELEFSHTLYAVSLIGIELTEDEERDLGGVIEAFAVERHPEAKFHGAALWTSRKLAPVKDFSPVTLSVSLKEATK